MLRKQEGDNLTMKKHGEIESCNGLLFFIKKTNKQTFYHSILLWPFVLLFIDCVVFLYNFCSSCCSILIKKKKKKFLFWDFVWMLRKKEGHREKYMGNLVLLCSNFSNEKGFFFWGIFNGLHVYFALHSSFILLSIPLF